MVRDATKNLLTIFYNCVQQAQVFAPIYNQFKERLSLSALIMGLQYLAHVTKMKTMNL